MIIAYYALHYGKDYLGWSIKSVYDFVDQIYILYTPNPSYGHGRTGIGNPDSRQDLKDAAHMFGDPKNKIKWQEGQWHTEGEHRGTIIGIANSINAEMILVVDSDEIWDPKVLEKALQDSRQSARRENCIRMLTFWKSFSWVCHDEMLPTRVISPRKPEGKFFLTGRVFHFGYARSMRDTEYKISIHGHKAEWRADWLERYRSWPASGNKDLHPTCLDVWDAVPYNKHELPAFLHSHPYFNQDVIH